MASIGAAISALLAAIISECLMMYAAKLLFLRGWMNDETAAWFGIFPGIPITVVVAVATFGCCFVKIKNYGRSIQK